LTRAFFENVSDSDLDIPFTPQPACDGPSDVHPIWQPEFYGDSIIVNGRTWPKLEVAPVRYRFRILNACNGRVLLLTLSDPNLDWWVIGNDGGYTVKPANLKTLIIAPAERLDVEIDFTNSSGQQIKILNVGPDGGYGDGAFDPADPETTGQIVRFDVVKKAPNDASTPPDQLVLPTITPIDPTNAPIRQVSVVDEDSITVKVGYVGNGSVYLNCSSDLTFEEANVYLGVFSGDPANGGTNTPLMWSSPVTEKPKKGVTEIWDFINLTEDAHPMHIHQVQFQVLKRTPIGDPDKARGPDVWETGFKDTLIIYPDEVTRVVMRFDIEGQFVWHCHLLEHEDNELMRPVVVSA
jgi:FtsP/CotA-like multicopper oxidase with cupredoxin domain